MTRQAEPLPGEAIPTQDAAAPPARWPDPNAPRAAVDAFVREQTPPPEPPELPHEVPPCENGPSIVCHACGVVRVSLHNAIGLCRNCRGGLVA